ncbi:two-component system VirA-like sensor kinase, partial [Methylobacterium organophilum]|nr:two-component system VirA-like sensor kinase [Methylobacterium organophilum]
QASNAGDADVRVLAEAVDREAEMVERFKTGNALVQNSIAYFDALSDRLSEPDVAPWLAGAVAALQIRVSELARESTHKRLDDVRGRLDALAVASHPADHSADIDAIVLHGRQLLELLPQVDAVTRSLPAFSSDSARQAFLKARRAAKDERQTRADRFRLALYAAALALVALVVRVGLLMRAGTLVLRRTIAFQTVVARAANHFLASQPDDISSRVDEVLAMLGEGAETDHCYVLMLDGTDKAHLWNRPGLPEPTGWPDAHRALIPDIIAAPDDYISIRMRDRSGPPALHRALAARGVVSWKCARLRQGERVVGLLCSERTSGDLPVWLRQSRVLLRIVCDSFTSALERQQVWAERREIEATLRRAQRLETIGIFASGVAHNVNNVLNVMLGHAEIAAGALPADPHRAARQIDLLIQAGGRAQEITGQILAYGRRGGATRSTSAVDAIVGETVAQIRSSATDPAAIRMTGAAEGAIVQGEPAQLQQVVHNLIRNAVQASDPGRAIDVQLERVQLSEPRTLSHGELLPGDYTRIRVADEGRGMDEATLARIFEPFFTTRPAGTGLGLATAFEFVQEQDGALHVQSALGRGSAFEVWLPVRPRAEASLSAAAGTVMIVGRAPTAVQEDEETLAVLGYEPIGYTDPDAALAALRKDPRRFDLLIVESQLADQSGLTFARSAAQIVNRPIVLSLSAADTVKPEVLSAIPIVDVARRPWRSNALALTLQNQLSRTKH